MKTLSIGLKNFEQKYFELTQLYSKTFSEFFKYKGDNPYLIDTIVYQKYDNVIINTENKAIDIIEIDMNSALEFILKNYTSDIYNLWQQENGKKSYKNKQDKYRDLMIFLRDRIFNNSLEYTTFNTKINRMQKMLTLLYVYSKYPIYEILELKKDSVIILTEKIKNTYKYYDKEILYTLKKQFTLTDKNFKTLKYCKYIRYDKTSIFQHKTEKVLFIKGKHKYLGSLFRLFILGDLNYSDIVRELNKLELIFKNDYRFLELYKDEIFDVLGDIDENKLYDVYTDKYISWGQFVNKPRDYFVKYPISRLYEKFVIPFLNI